MGILYIETDGDDGTGTKDNPALPYATFEGANADFSSGDTFQFGDGSHDINDGTQGTGDGEIRVGVTEMNITGTNSYGATLNFVGTGTGNCFRVNSNATTSRILTIGEVNITSPDGKTVVVFLSGTNGHNKIQFTSSARYVMTTTSGTNYLIRASGDTHKVSIPKGSATINANAVSFRSCIYMANMAAETCLDVDEWIVDVDGNITANEAGSVYLTYKESTLAASGTHDGSSGAAVLTDSGEAWDIDRFIGCTIKNTTDGSEGIITANTATTITATLAGGTDNDWDGSDAYTIHGTVDITGVTGPIVDGSSTGTIYHILTNNAPTHSIHDCTGLSLTTSSRSACLANIQATGGYGQTTDCLISNITGTVDSSDGFLALFGGESATHDCTGTIENCDIKGVDGTSTNLHGICFISANGVMRNNKSGYCELPYLAKLSLAQVHDNYAYGAQGTDAAYLYAKATTAGTRFINNVCNVPDDFDGVIEQSKTHSATDADNPEFYGTKVYSDGGDLNSGCVLNSTGTGGGDNSTSTTRAMTIDSSLTLPTNLAQYQGTSYTTLPTWNAISTAGDAWQSGVKQLESTSFAGGAGSNKTIGSFIS